MTKNNDVTFQSKIQKTITEKFVVPFIDFIVQHLNGGYICPLP